MKWQGRYGMGSAGTGRSRKGAWIEIEGGNEFDNLVAAVAPVRERGLKSSCIARSFASRLVAPVRERGLKFDEQAIEIAKQMVAPVRERGLKYYELANHEFCITVAPVRERGLKYQCELSECASSGSLP